MLKRFRSFLVVYLYCAFCTSLNARIPIALLEAFNKDLNSSHYFNLIWGAVAIESGFIYNLRFFGDYNFNFSGEKRNYKDDEAKQDLFDIVKTLFPSNGGLLSTTISAFNKICNELTCEDAMKILVACFKDTSQITITQELFSKNKRLKKTEGFNAFLEKIMNIVNAANISTATDSEKETKEILAQVLLGFIYEKINVKEINQQDPLETNIDAQKTLKNLRELIPINSDYSNNASEKAIAFFKSLWNKNPFPYLTSPISNGISNVVKKNSQVNEKAKFADCVEVTIRHMLNILFYDPKSGNFNIPILANKKKVIADFYAIQKDRDMANNGSLYFRTEWNKVMVHIPNVIYKVNDDGEKLNDNSLYTYDDKSNICGTNEIKAGLINLYNILAYILGKEQIKRKNCESKEKLLEMLNEQVDMDKGEQIKSESDVIRFLNTKFEALFSNNEDGGSDEFDFPSNLLFDLSEINISIENLDYDCYDVYADLHIKGKKTCQEISEKEYAFDIHIEKGHGNIALIDPKKISSFIDISNENLDGLEKSLHCFEPFEKKLFSQDSFWGLYLEKLDTLSAFLRFAYNISDNKILSLPSLKENLDFNIKKLITTENDVSISLRTQDITRLEGNFYKFLTESDFCTENHPIKKGKEKSYRDCIKQIDLYVNDEKQLTLDCCNFGKLEKLTIKAVQGESVKLKLENIKGNLTICIENLSNLKNIVIENPKNCCFHEIKKCESLESIKISESEGTKIEECTHAINGKFLYENWGKKELTI